MANLTSVSRSILFLVISVGGIGLSIVIAFLIVSYNPTRFSHGLSGWSIGIFNSIQPYLDSINGNRTEVLIDRPEISEQGHGIVMDEVPALAPELSVDANNSVSVIDIKDPNVSVSSVLVDDSGNDGTKSDSYIGVEVPASAPALYMDVSLNGDNSKEPNVPISPGFADDSGKNGNKIYGYIGVEMPAVAPALSLNANSSVSVSALDIKELNVSASSNFLHDSGENSFGIGNSTVDSLNQTGSVATLPSPSQVLKKSNLSNCDLFHGKWFYDPAGPLYTNNTCPVLAQMQNCQGNGRPDKNYENWRWKPNECEIPRFDGRKFLGLMRGKTLAFVGDSIARNQMESLLCILWQTEVPINHGNSQMKKWHFRSTSTTIIRIWSAWLVHKTPLPIPSSSPRSVNVHLDTPDKSFINFLPEFDVLILSSGHWFSTETTYLFNNTIKKTSKKDIIRFYDLALQTTLNSILEFSNYTGLVILRSYSPEHYIGGAWNSGGGCSGIDKPARKSIRSGYTNSMEKVQVVEFEKAAKNLRNGFRLRFMDVTELSGYRNDGHAGKYGRKVWKKNAAEDCLHWCMPGIVDTWNEVLFEMLKREF